MPMIIFYAFVATCGGLTLDHFFLRPRRWMKRFGTGNYHGDRKALRYFVRQYKANRLLESYGENPTGKDRG